MSEWTLPSLILLLTQTVLLQEMLCLPRVERRGCEGMLFFLTGLFQDVWLTAGLTMMPTYKTRLKVLGP